METALSETELIKSYIFCTLKSLKRNVQGKMYKNKCKTEVYKMKRKAFIALLAASMVLGVCTPAFAAEDIEVESATPVEAENQASKVVVAVDDDSFTIGPWGSDSAV